MSFDKFTQKTGNARQYLYKTLSSNDYLWANVSNIHQSGVLIGKDLCSFFPAVDLTIPIFTKDITTYWLEDDNWVPYASKWKHYESKKEYRTTTVSKSSFKQIQPGSMLLMARTGDAEYYCYVVDAGDSDEYDYALDYFELRDSPKWGILERKNDFFIEEDALIDNYFANNPLPEIIPNIDFLSTLSEKLFSQKYQGLDFNSSEPGDLLEKLIDFEYKIYKRYEANHYAIRLKNLSEPDIYHLDTPEKIKSFYSGRIDEFSQTFLSMANARKSRVGVTYETHFRHYLDRIKVKYSYQIRIDGKKKPDFIIPSVELYNTVNRQPDDVILLSLKTTLKERWAQILNEGSKVDTRYLATLDKKVTADQIDEMQEKKVVLVVTEWAKSNTSTYKSADNVMSLKYFSNIMLSKSA